MEALVQRLESGEQAAFEELVSALVSPDNASRKQAEEFYKQLLENRSDVVVRYLASGLSHQNAEMQSFCAVYLRKESVKQEGMRRITEEKNKKLMHKLCDTMSEVAQQTWAVEEHRWLGILHHIQTFIESQQDTLVEAALILFSHITVWLGADDVLKQRAGHMYNVLLSCLKHGNVDVQFAACQAATNFIESFENADEIAALHGLVRSMLDVMGKKLAAGDEDEASTVLNLLAELAETEPRLFKPAFADFATVVFQIVRSTDFDSGTRQSALEVVLRLVEMRPILIRKSAAHLTALCEATLVLLLEVEDAPEWHTAVDETNAEAGQDELYEYGLEALDRVAQPIGGKSLMPVLYPMLQQWATDADWRKRQGALVSISQIAEGCRKTLLPDDALRNLMMMCCVAAQDPHAHVKWSCCQAIGQVCTDLAPKVQKKHHGDMMQALIHLMGPSEEPRVQAHAASAIVNFCDGLDGNIVGLYVKALTDRLVALLSSPSQLVVEGALTAISSVADSCGELFSAYYDAVMPTLKKILIGANDKSQRRLRGKTLECISLIGMNVGKDVFYKDASDFIQVLTTLHSTPLEADDPLLSYMQSAGTRMCKCLGADFTPLLPVFMPALLNSAGKKSELETVDPEDVGDDENYEMYSVGDKVIRINTAHHEEKLNALNMLACYAEDMKESFFPYCAEVAKIVEHVLTVPLLNDDEMRRTCAMIVPSLINCVQLAAQKQVAGAGDGAVKEIFDMMMAALLKGLKNELESEVVHEMLDALEQLVDLASAPLLTVEVVSNCFEQLHHRLKMLMDVKSMRAEAQKSGEDYDEEDIEQMREEAEMDEEVMQQLVSAIGAFLRKFGNDVLPKVEELLQAQFNAMLLEAGRPDDDRWHALMLVTDVVEYCPASERYLPHLLPKLLEFSQSGNAKLCNASVYGLGVIAEKHPAAFAQQQDTILDVVCKTIKRLDGNDDWEHARDNAVAALGKILRFHPEFASGETGDRLGHLWLHCLPLYEDEVEAAKQHEMLHQFLLANDARILGANNGNLMKIAEVFVRVIAKGDELLDSEQAPAFTTFFLTQLKPVLEGQGFQLQQALGMLEPKDQQRFQAAIGPHAQ